jgi:hypothetical protein
MNIRVAVSGDERRLAELNAIVQEMHLAVAPELFKTPDLDAISEYLVGLLCSDNVTAFIAEDGDAH